jgi:uncharacterized linocin/CFP29 family protein
MDLLKRELAPILPEGWAQIDEEAKRVLKLHLAGRKLVDFSGPHGWKLGAVNTGRIRPLNEGPAPQVSAGLRIVQPLVELRTPFTVPIAELDSAARGANDLDLDAVIEAAERTARAEDRAIFHGYAAGDIKGIIQASPIDPVVVKANVEWPHAVGQAKERLRAAGTNGPYALALGPLAHAEVTADSEDGYPLRKRIEGLLIDGPIVWAPAIEGGAVLMSTRGGDYELTVGQDLSIGYTAHGRDEVELYITESFTFRILEEKAAVFLRRTEGPSKP